MAVTNLSSLELGSSGGSETLKINGVTQNVNSITSVTAGQTLTIADNGKTLLLGDAASGNITLPAVTITGFYCRVWCNFTITTSSAVISAEGDNISGNLLVQGGQITAAAEDQINFIANTALTGDWCEFLSTGTTWLCNGVAQATGGLTATDPA